MRIRRTALPFAACILASAIGAQVSQAQGMLEEIIVTAEKRVSTIQDTPIAISAFSGDELERGLINNTLDLQMNVPNMLMSKGNFTTAQVSIRGIGNLGVGSATDSGTGIHFNGVYLNSPRVFETEFYDTERVEILRGPQGTLYGRNTTAGVVNVISRKPDDEFGGDIQVSLGNYDAVKAKGAINFPMGENFAQRFAGFYSKRDGFVDNVFDGNDIDSRDMFALRSSTLWRGDNTDATLVINYFEEDDSRMRGSNQRCLKDVEGILGCLPTGLADENTHSAATVTGLLTGVAGSILGLEFPDDDFANSVGSSDPRKQNLDFHALFISLARSEGIPARFEIGFPVPSERSSGDIKGYHCWVQFFLAGRGWVPIDASEAAKNPDKREQYYGAQPADRIHFSTGRDLTLSAQSKKTPLNYFIYPYVEVGGKPWNEKLDTRFHFQEID